MIRLGIIGCGRVTTLFHLKAINEVDEIDVVAVVDIDSTRMEDVKQKTNADEGYLDYIELLSDPQVDAVTINTPPEFHLSMILDSLKSRKHVQCEKPIALSGDECNKILQEQVNSGLVVLPIHNYAFSPSLLKMEEYIEQIGEVDMVKINFLNNLRGYRSQTDFRLNKLDSIVDDVFPHLLSVSTPFVGVPNKVDSVEWWCKTYDVCDNMDVTLRTENGVELCYRLNWTSIIPRFKVEIEGDKGTLKTELMLSPYKVTLEKMGKVTTYNEGGFEWFLDLIRFKHPGFENQYRHLASLVSGEINKPRFTIQEEMKMIEIMEEVSEYFEV